MVEKMILDVELHDQEMIGYGPHEQYLKPIDETQAAQLSGSLLKPGSQVAYPNFQVAEEKRR